jgi:hypothetical protein
VSPTDDLRWTDVMEFLEEYRHESPATRQSLLAQTPEESAEPKWDVFLGALAEHLAIGDTQPVPLGRVYLNTRGVDEPGS